MIDRKKIIDDVFKKEGDKYGDQTTRPRIDQPTARGGITLPVWSEFIGRAGTIEQLKTMSHETARAVVDWKLKQIEQRMKLGVISFEPLKMQIIDFGYNSGEERAMRWLQRVLRVLPTGKMDIPTQRALIGGDPWLIHQALIAARLQMIDMATDPGGSVDAAFEEGLENRALTFSLLDVK